MTPRALLLIDIQVAFDDRYWGARNNPQAEENAGRLLAHWRAAEAPVFHVRHLSVEPASPLNPVFDRVDFKPEVTPLPGEPVLQKHVNSAFIGTNLEARLVEAGIERLTICGLTTPHCVSTTARMAANLGFSVELVHDACAAFTRNANTAWRGGGAVSAEAIHAAALDQLNGEFARVMGVAEVLAERP
ncbi:cysteine hydrolase family protein [Sinisalibacter aestuarii]|uniref:Isochorismatase n=1 Tax=Sinisalibacter aestuarii TaxID=2949426 RepID=A0ABQ5M081_9RHOB|nr:cysteine hydrolase family protein [Sinisalibacter aestuarii]GKY90201.1 isochorismatase [Sinisalibacter aestuarii]